MLLKILIVALLTISITHQGASSLSPNRQEPTQVKRECLERANDLDRCLPKLVLYGDRDFVPPRDAEQLDNHCRNLDENLRCVSSYSRECLPSFVRNLYSVITRRLKVQFSKRCKNPAGRKEFLELMACADVHHMEPGHQCMDSFIAHLEHIGAESQSKGIELTCCTFLLFQDCIFSASRNMKCSKRTVTAEKSIEYVRTIINSMGGDVMDFMCGKYEKVQACQAGYPAYMSKFNEITSQVHNKTLKPQNGSPLKPMLKLFIANQDE